MLPPDPGRPPRDEPSDFIDWLAKHGALPAPTESPKAAPPFPANLGACLRWLGEYELLRRRVEFVAASKGVDYALGGEMTFGEAGVDLYYDEYAASITWDEILATDEEVLRAKEERLRQEAEEQRRKADMAATWAVEQRHTDDVARLARLVQQFPDVAARLLAAPPAKPPPRNPRTHPRVGDAVTWKGFDGIDNRSVENTARIVEIDAARGGVFVTFKVGGDRHYWPLDYWQATNGHTTWIPGT